MIFIWRGWGLLPILALLPVPAAFAATMLFQPIWIPAAAAGAALAFGGWVCLHYGRRWNREEVGHSLYFIRLEAWGWLYLLAGVAVAAAALGAWGYEVATGQPTVPTPPPT